MATLTRHPNEVLTDRGDNPRPEKRAENADVKLIRGRSSATTTQDRTQARFTPFACHGKKPTGNETVIHKACERGRTIYPLMLYKYPGLKRVPNKIWCGRLFERRRWIYVAGSEPGGGIHGRLSVKAMEFKPSEMAF